MKKKSIINIIRLKKNTLYVVLSVNVNRLAAWCMHGAHIGEILIKEYLKINKKYEIFFDSYFSFGDYYTNVTCSISSSLCNSSRKKTMASMQRRLGPNAVGYYGLLQAFADALKLILKEYVAPTQANIILFF